MIFFQTEEQKEWYNQFAKDLPKKVAEQKSRNEMIRKQRELDQEMIRKFKDSK